MELRKDYILDRWVFLAAGRRQRPMEFKGGNAGEQKTCYFCAGNESQTPPEIGRIQKGSKDGREWLIRWFFNKFPAVSEQGSPEVKTDNTFFTYSDAFGRHEIIAETPKHEEQLWSLSNEHVVQLLKLYFGRIEDLGKAPGISYVSVFKNHGSEAGASLAHSHAQVVSMSAPPNVVREEVSASRMFGSCPYCRIIEVEGKSFRRCFENSSFLAFTPYASRFNYEAWIFPKRHVSMFSELSSSEVNSLAEILGNVLKRLKSINAPYNFFLHYSSKSDGLHAHIEVLPRLSLWAGLEFSTGAVINTVTPEDAAAFYRGEV